LNKTKTASYSKNKGKLNNNNKLTSKKSEHSGGGHIKSIYFHFKNYYYYCCYSFFCVCSFIVVTAAIHIIHWHRFLNSPNNFEIYIFVSFGCCDTTAKNLQQKERNSSATKTKARNTSEET